MFTKQLKKGVAGENGFLFKLHSELGPVYRLKMPGKFYGRGPKFGRPLYHCKLFEGQGS